MYYHIGHGYTKLADSSPLFFKTIKLFYNPHHLAKYERVIAELLTNFEKKKNTFLLRIALLKNLGGSLKNLRT